jgi:hypothetical protein
MIKIVIKQYQYKIRYIQVVKKRASFPNVTI